MSTIVLIGLMVETDHLKKDADLPVLWYSKSVSGGLVYFLFLTVSKAFIAL